MWRPHLEQCVLLCQGHGSTFAAWLCLEPERAAELPQGYRLQSLSAREHTRLWGMQHLRAELQIWRSTGTTVLWNCAHHAESAHPAALTLIFAFQFYIYIA